MSSRWISRLVETAPSFDDAAMHQRSSRSFQNPIFDISIDVDASQNVSKFLEQVIVYLHMIKTTT